MAEGSKRLLLFAGIGAVLFLLVSLLAGPKLLFAWRARGFPEAKVRELDAVSFPTAPEGRLYRKGKVVIVKRRVTNADAGGDRADLEMQPPALDPDWGRLPDALRASTPAEAGTLLLVRRKVSKAGTYVRSDGSLHGTSSDRAAAHQHSARVWVYDLEARVFLGETEVSGKAPPGQREKLSQDGQPADLVAFVEKLPPG